MRRWVLLWSLLASLTVSAQAPVPVTFVWDVEVGNPGVLAEVERNGVAVPCGTFVVISSTERHCAMAQPLGPATFRARMANVSGQWGPWSDALAATVGAGASPGAFTITWHGLVAPTGGGSRVANFGRETVGATPFSFENIVFGHPVTMPENGDITSITAYLVDALDTHTVKFVLYDASGNVLGETPTSTAIPTSPGWLQISFSTPITVTGGTQLVLAAAGSGGGGTVDLYCDAGSAGDGKSLVITFPTIPNPSTFGDESFVFSIYATYTPPPPANPWHAYAQMQHPGLQ